ncbi:MULTISPECIES: CaiB/BaiF CoA-transferase family protein [unclassified Chelatococcus]|uniref:CaiB/BaiF CoA transferase family protein n=1 Tax=unclassified Chelatococcus TaxID=2638111 RepID=UPI0025C1D656|nr:CaiB/BaiF CoA-transferase family protein [Chelatococcus sp.]
MSARASGPLSGVRVIEMEGVGPAPFCGMLLSDMGADVVRIERPMAGDAAVDLPAELDPTLRGRRTLTLDLKALDARAEARALIARADILIEGYRPGVMERLGLGPEACLADNPRLVYGRITGWGQSGPLARTAGHDINYIALTGVLDSIGEDGRAPVPPLNLVGDFGGGAMFLAFGVACALLHARATGQGQVVDAAMVDGASALMAQFYGFLAQGSWLTERGQNILDGGAPWYGTYETADGRHIAAGAFEGRFWLMFLEGLGLDAATLPPREERTHWPALRARIAAVIKAQPLAHWQEVFDGSDACVMPVLTLNEAHTHPHLVERGTFGTVDGLLQPSPAPRFSRTPGQIQTGLARDTDAATILAEWA